MIDAVHLHLLLNHVSVIGVIGAACLLAYAILKKSDELKQVSLGLLIIAALFAIPVYLSGEPSEDLVEKLPGVSKPIIERHEEAAQIAFTGLSVLGFIALVDLAFFRRTRKISTWFSYLLLLLAFAVGGAMAWTANLGGQVRHTEIRAQSVNAPPAEVDSKAPETKQETDGDDR